MANYSISNYSSGYGSGDYGYTPSPSTSSTSVADKKGYTPVSSTAKATTASAKKYQSTYASSDNYESPSKKASTSGGGLGSRQEQKQETKTGRSTEDRFADAWNSSGGSSYDTVYTPPTALSVYDTPEAQAIGDYLTGTAIQDALYEAQGLINQSYNPRMEMSVRPMTEEEIKKFVPVQNLNNSGITVEQLSSMDAPQQKATLESLGITNAQWVSSQGPRPMSLQEFDQATMASVHYGQPLTRDPKYSMYNTIQQPTQQGLGYTDTDVAPSMPSAEQIAVMPDAPGLMAAPTLGEAPSVDALSNQMLEVPEVPAVEETTASGEGLMSKRLDAKGTKVTKYDTMLNSNNQREFETGVQGKLTKLGYVPRGIDGQIGDSTRAAIRSFQKANGLTVNGEVDDATLSKLQSPSAKRYKFSDAVEGAYKDFAGSEETKAHLGGADYKNVGITLAYGVLPDSGLKYKHNGKVINLPKEKPKRWAALSAAGVTTKNFNPDNVITDDAVKAGVRRGDYRSDEEWAKASITAFEDMIKNSMIGINVNPDDVNSDVMKGLISFNWNTGGHNWEGAKNAYREVVKDNPNMNTIKNGLLQVFTSGGTVYRGLAKRRAADYNMIAEGLNKPKIESYTPVILQNGNAGFKFNQEDDTSFTIDTGKNYSTNAGSGNNFKSTVNQTFSVNE